MELVTALRRGPRHVAEVRQYGRLETSPTVQALLQASSVSSTQIVLPSAPGVTDNYCVNSRQSHAYLLDVGKCYTSGR